MSVQAIAWVLDDAPDLPAHLLGTLIVVANHADTYGKNSWPSQGTIARQARKSERAVRNDLADLERRGLIVRGNQRLVLHIREDRRPVVWDLPMSRQEADDRKWTAGRGVPGGTGQPDVHGRHGGKPASAKPSMNLNTPLTPESDLSGACERHAESMGRRHPRCRACGTAGRPRCARKNEADRLSNSCLGGNGSGCKQPWCQCACHEGNRR